MRPEIDGLPEEPKLKMVFVVGEGVDKAIKDIKRKAKKLKWKEGVDYIIIGDGKKDIDEVVKEFDVIKGRVDKDSLFVVVGHGINREEKKKNKKGLFHFTGNMLTGEIFNRLKIASGLEHIFGLAVACQVGGFLKRGEVGPGITVLACSNSKSVSLAYQNISLIKRAMSLKDKGKSVFQIFKNLVQNSVQTFYFLRNGLKAVKISRPIKFTFDEIGKILQKINSKDWNLKIQRLKEANKKNKQDFSYEGIQKLASGSKKLVLPSEFYEELKEEHKEKLKEENITKFLIERGEKFFPEQDEKLIKSESDEKKDSDQKFSEDMDEKFPKGKRFVNEILNLEMRKKQSQVLRTIINENKELVDYQDKYGDTLLMRSVAGYHLNVMALIEYGAEIDKVNKYNNTALIIAARSKYVIEYYDNIVSLQILIEAGADINKADIDGRTALIYSVIGKKKDAFQILIRSGANLDIQDKFGNTALIYAIENNDLEMAEIIVKAGANIDIRNKNGKDALAIAKDKLPDSKKILDFLVKATEIIEEKKEDKDEVKEKKLDKEKSESNKSPIIDALNSGNMKQFRLLVKNPKSDLKEKDYHGRTPLMIAISNNNIRAVAALLIRYKEIDLCAKDKYDNTILTRVAETQNNKIAKLVIGLLSNTNLKINHQELLMDKALKIAIDSSNFYLAFELTKIGADISPYHSLIQDNFKIYLDLQNQILGKIESKAEIDYKDTKLIKFQSLLKLKQLSDKTKDLEGSLSKIRSVFPIGQVTEIRKIIGIAKDNKNLDLRFDKKGRSNLSRMLIHIKPNVVSELLEYISEVEEKKIFFIKDYKERTPLHIAISKAYKVRGNVVHKKNMVDIVLNIAKKMYAFNPEFFSDDQQNQYFSNKIDANFKSEMIAKIKEIQKEVQKIARKEKHTELGKLDFKDPKDGAEVEDQDQEGKGIRFHGKFEKLSKDFEVKTKMPEKTDYELRLEMIAKIEEAMKKNQEEKQAELEKKDKEEKKEKKEVKDQESGTQYKIKNTVEKISKIKKISKADWEALNLEKSVTPGKSPQDPEVKTKKIQGKTHP